MNTKAYKNAQRYSSLKQQFTGTIQYGGNVAQHSSDFIKLYTYNFSSNPTTA